MDKSQDFNDGVAVEQEYDPADGGAGEGEGPVAGPEGGAEELRIHLIRSLGRP